MNTFFSVAIAPFHERAQANADYFGVPYACFFDTAGQYRVERYDPNQSCHRFNATIFYPAQYDTSRVALLGED
jgi:hypothetical protein